MLLSDGTGLSRLTKALAGVALLGLIAGCQVRPLYSTPGGTEGKLASISISEARHRVEQQVRNDLVFLLAGGAGEPRNAIYHLEMSVSSGAAGVLTDVRTEKASAGRVIVSATYTLTRPESDETLASGTRSAVALVDFPAQEFAKLRAIRDAENRGARELAELIRADIASALAKR